MNSTSSKRNKQIDGLRGIACIIILIFHLFCRYLQIYEESNIEWMAQWGTFGVIVFIIISGYFLGLESIKEESSKFELIKYLKKKIIRLWGCYIIALTITMIIVKLIGLPGRECSWLDYILNIFFINGFLGMPYVDGAHWYLTTLISITIIMGIIKKIRLKDNVWIYCMWLFIVGLLIKLGYSNITVFAGGTYLGSAIAGVALARIFSSNQQSTYKRWIILFICSILFCYIIKGVTETIIVIVALLIVIPCLLEKFKLFENSILLKLGMISYPVYLIHQNIGFVIIIELSKIFGRLQDAI